MFGKISKLALRMSLVGGVMMGNCNAVPQVSGELSQDVNYNISFKNKETGTFLCISLSISSSPSLSAEYTQVVSQKEPNWLKNDKLTKDFLERSAEELEKQKGLTAPLFIFINNLSGQMDKSEGVGTTSGNDFDSDLESEKTKKGKLVEDTSEESFEESDNYTLEQLQDDISVGITSYIRNPEDPRSKFIIESTLKLMLRFPKSQYTNEQIMEDIAPLKYLPETIPLYNELEEKIEKREEK